MLLTFLFIITCKQEKKEINDSRYSKWLKKEIIFPEDLFFTHLLEDTSILNISKSNMKVLTYADTTGCMGCKLQLNKWKEFITMVDSISKDTITFLFFLFPSDMEELKYLIKSENFEYPICIDINDQLNRLNRFSSDISFLLDENNQVIATGNPILDLNIRDLYLEKISGKKNPQKSRKTLIEIEQTDINIGTLNKLETKEIFIKLKNIGNEPFVIISVNSSCGCITASFDKQPVKSGNITEVKLKVTPTEIGFMKKTIKIHGNIDKPAVINIQGQVKE